MGKVHLDIDPHEVLSDYLASTGRRATAERTMILDAALRLPPHFRAEEVAEALDAVGQHVALSTVYYTLPVLVEAGLLERHNLDGDSWRYEVPGTPHHHLLCVRCGKIRDMRDRALDTLLRTKRFTAFSPQTFSLTVTGICSTCRRAAKDS